MFVGDCYSFASRTGHMLSHSPCDFVCQIEYDTVRPSQMNHVERLQILLVSMDKKRIKSTPHKALLDQRPTFYPRCGRLSGATAMVVDIELVTKRRPGHSRSPQTRHCYKKFAYKSLSVLLNTAQINIQSCDNKAMHHVINVQNEPTCPCCWLLLPALTLESGHSL